MEQKSFVKAMRDQFGFRPGDTLKDFSAELRALTDKDRQELTEEFGKIGVEIVAPS